MMSGFFIELAKYFVSNFSIEHWSKQDMSGHRLTISHRVMHVGTFFFVSLALAFLNCGSIQFAVLFQFDSRGK